MKKPFETFILGIFISLAFIGCKNSREGTNTDKSEMNKENLIEDKVEQTLCFRNEYPFQNEPTKKDVLELNLTIMGDNVTGHYNWLPAEKDQRKGSLKGEMKDNVIEANYIFSQEGINDTIPITIILGNHEAIIKSENAELGLDATIKEIDCDKE